MTDRDQSHRHRHRKERRARKQADRIATASLRAAGGDIDVFADVDAKKAKKAAQRRKTRGRNEQGKSEAPQD